MVEPRDRYVVLLKSSSFNGIDFVTVDAVDPRTLYVHLLNAVAVEAATILNVDPGS